MTEKNITTFKKRMDSLTAQPEATFHHSWAQLPL